MKYCRAASRRRPVVRGTKVSAHGQRAAFSSRNQQNSESKGILSRHYRAIMDRKRGAERMSNGSTPAMLLRQFEDLFTAGAVGGLSDGELLERFIQDRGAAGEAAFRALVERHGPMVLRVCNQTLTIATRPRMRFRPRFWCWHGRRARSASVIRWLAGCSGWPAGPRRGSTSRRHDDDATSARARRDWQLWRPVGRNVQSPGPSFTPRSSDCRRNTAFPSSSAISRA